MNKHLLNEINRVKTIMGVKPLLTEGIGTLGLDLLQWMTRTSVKVLDEVPGLVDNFGNPLKKVFYQFGDVKVPENVYEIFKKLCDGTESFNNLISKGRKDVVDMFLDVIEKSDILDNEIEGLINFARQSTANLTEESILRAIKKEIDNGKSIDDVLSEMTGGDEFAMNVLKRKFSQKLDNLADEVESFGGNTFDDLKSALQKSWSQVITPAKVGKTIKTRIFNFLSSDGMLRTFRATILQMIKKNVKRYDVTIDEMISKWEEVFNEVLNNPNYIKSIKNNKNLFRGLNIDIDAISVDMSNDIRNFLLSEIKKLEFQTKNGVRKLTESEFNEIKKAFMGASDVFDNTIPDFIKKNGWVRETFYNSYYGRFFTQGGKFNRFVSWALTGTARTGQEWSLSLRSKKGFWEYFGAYAKSVASITVVCKGLLPSIIALGYFIANMYNFYTSKEIKGKYGEIAKISFKEAYKNALAPFDSDVKNILNILIPIHVPASQFITAVMEYGDKFLSGVGEDKINLESTLADIRSRFSSIPDDEWKKIESFLKNSGMSLEQLEGLNMDEFNNDLKTVEKISETDTSTWEPGFKAWARLRMLTDMIFNTNTGMGQAKNPVNGQFQVYEIVPKDKTFIHTENN